MASAKETAWQKMIEGERLLQQGETRLAAVTLTAAIKLDIRLKRAYQARAEAFRRLGMEREAEADLLIVDELTRNPNTTPRNKPNLKPRIERDLSDQEYSNYAFASMIFGGFPSYMIMRRFSHRPRLGLALAIAFVLGGAIVYFLIAVITGG